MQEKMQTPGFQQFLIVLSSLCKITLLSGVYKSFRFFLMKISNLDKPKKNFFRHCFFNFLLHFHPQRLVPSGTLKRKLIQFLIQLFFFKKNPSDIFILFSWIAPSARSPATVRLQFSFKGLILKIYPSV